jgi:hypothetical protein
VLETCADNRIAIENQHLRVLGAIVARGESEDSPCLLLIQFVMLRYASTSSVSEGVVSIGRMKVLTKAARE